MSRGRRVRQQRRKLRAIDDEDNFTGSIIYQAIGSFIKNILLGRVLLEIIHNPTPARVSASYGPSIYLFSKTMLCPVLLLLLRRLANKREDRFLLCVILLVFRFVTTTTYGRCINTIDVDVESSCILECIVTVTAGTILFLILLIWAAIKETGPTLLLFIALLYFASKVVEFSIYRAKVLGYMVWLSLWMGQNLHTFHIVDEHVHNQLEIIRSKITFYGFCSVVMICSVNSIVTGLANLEGTGLLGQTKRLNIFCWSLEEIV